MTPQQVRTALKQLGFSPEEVAHSLMELGIKGKIHDADHCPLAVYLLRQGARFITVHAHCLEFERLKVRTPSAIARFISLFDAGRWPEVIQAC